ncbi:hypothetical protein GE09DRAFT_1292000 [Coniochaeta sp. 2T2.1]|nr:hypothetical protein GE09DRAFT_1292000 [Coniochaeta sp. 2T2.1]
MSVCGGRERRWWTKSEDELLRNWAEVQITTQGAVKNWNDAAALLPGRTNKDCRKRWHKVRQDIRKGAWMPEEDEKLQQAVTQAGLKWSTVSKVVKTRNADQCAKSWQQVLGPDRNHGPWTPEEDKILRDAIQKYGNNWKQIGLTELPDRSTHDIRNRSVALNRRSRSSVASRSKPSQRRHDDDMASDLDVHGSGDTSEDDGTEEMYSDSEAASGALAASSAWPSRSTPDSDGVNQAMETWAATQTNDIPDASADQTLFPTWDMFDPCTLMPLAAGTDVEMDSMSWFGVQTQEMDMDRTYMSPGMILDDSCIDFNLLGSGDMVQDMPESSNLQAETSQASSQNNNSSTASGSSSRTPSDNRSTPNSTDEQAHGNVTVVLTKANSHLAQEVIGKLLRMNADLTIRLVKD